MSERHCQWLIQLAECNYKFHPFYRYGINRLLNNHPAEPCQNSRLNIEVGLRTLMYFFNRLQLFYSHSHSKPSAQYWILALFLLMLFATGGSSRTDVASLVVLRPLSIIICAWGCTTLRRAQFEGRLLLMGGAGAIFLLTVLHLLPLPPGIWGSLPGHESVLKVHNFSDRSGIWHPLTLSSIDGWSAFVSLFVPLAVLTLGVQLTRDELFGLLPVVIGLAALSGLLGLLQVIGDAKGALYFYEITNHGSAVGLFANRNHAATLLTLLLPMLAIFASPANQQARATPIRRLLAPSIAIVLVPLILVTGSRSGLVGAVIGLVAAALLYRRKRDTHNSPGRKLFRSKVLLLIAAVGIVVVSFLTYFFARAEAIERLFIQSSAADDRSDFLLVSLDLLGQYFTLGSGSGSFLDAYRMAEPIRLLDATYLNHAHNDWIETTVTFGLPGLIILILAILGFGIRSYRLWRSVGSATQARAFGQLASVMIAMMAIASAADYPLRTPTMMGIFALSVLWLIEAGRTDPERSPLLAKRSHKDDGTEN